MRTALRICLLLSCLPLFLVACTKPRPAPVEKIWPPTTTPTTQVGQRDEVRLIAFGDWGTPNKDRQTVADAMSRYLAQHPADAALLLGDNFLVKLKDTEDPQIQKLFELTYDRSKHFDFPFYAALGNHDYMGNDAAIELAYPLRHPQTRWHLPSRWYRLDFPTADDPLATILMLDSNKGNMRASDWQAQIRWIRQELSKPHGQWTICCAHHTIFSNGPHGDNGVLLKEWGSIFQEQHVDFYICGHDHTLQHLERPTLSTSFIVSGGGAAGRYPMLRDDRGPFSRSQAGFVYLRLTPELAEVRILDAKDNLLHEFTRDTQGKLMTFVNSPIDKATKHKLRVIEGIDTTTSRPAMPQTTQSSKGGN